MTTPTQGEHAQPEALAHAAGLESFAESLPAYGFNPQPLKDAADEMRRLHAQNEALIGGLKKANEQAEHFEREWYLRGDEIEALHAQVAALTAAVPTLEQAKAIQRAIEVLDWLPTHDNQRPLWDKHQAALVGLRNAFAAPVQPAAPQGGAYAELPIPSGVSDDGYNLFLLTQMRDFADRTHALRGQQLGPSKQQPFGWIKQSEIDNSKDFGGSINLWRRQYDCDVPVYLAPQPATTAQPAPAATPTAASLAWNALRDLTDPLGEDGAKIMGHIRTYAQRQYEAGLAEGRAAPALAQKEGK